MTAPSERPIAAAELVAGLAAAGLRAGAGVARTLAAPARAAAEAPVIGPPLRRTAERLAADGRAAIARGRAEAEAVAVRVLAAPEVARTIDSTLEGPLTDALGHSVAEHRVAERVAGELIVAGTIEHSIVAALDSEEAERLLARALESPGLVRLVAAVLESSLAPEITDRLLRSPELTAILEYVATSPEVRRVLQEQSASLADEMVDDLRGRTERLDSVAENTVRGWLRRPRPSTG